MRPLFRRSLLALALLGACAQADDPKPGSGDPAGPNGPSDLAPGVVSDSPLAVVTHRMLPGSSSTVSLRTLPNAVCSLSTVGTTQNLRVFADDDGVARVHLDHLDASVRQGSLALACQDDAGQTMTHTINVVIDDSAVPQAPVRYETAGKPTLVKLDAVAAFSQSDLSSRHYPPRPTGSGDSDELATWTRLASSAPTIVAPHVVGDRDRNHSTPNTSNNWSGYVLTSGASAPIYAWIYGQWNVPRAYAESGFASWDHSSFWVGIDGWGSNDVVQDGTDQDTLTVFWVQTSSYDAWVEWYPLSSQTVSNFPVNPGDRIHAWTWVTDANSNYSSNPTVGWFYMWNETENVYVYTSITLPSGATFSGHSAEWVMERPTVLGSISNLANYSTAQLTNATVYDLAGKPHLYGGDSSDVSHQVTMTGNNNAALSTVAPVNASTMAFTFHGHN